MEGLMRGKEIYGRKNGRRNGGREESSKTDVK